MKVFAINSSPRPEGHSKTALLLNRLVKGMRDAEADVYEVALREKKINPCLGCYTCWTVTPGKCKLDDDMSNELYPRWLECDMAIYATPLYNMTMSSHMKAFIERLMPMAEPYILEKDGAFYHPRRTRYPGTVLLSVCGFPDVSQFDVLSANFKNLFGISFRGEILRTGSEGLTVMGPKLEEILEATERAGSELIKRKRIAKKTLDTITQPLPEPELIGQLANLMWKTCIDEGITPQEFWERRLIPRPDSIETFLSIMRHGFNPGGAAGADAVIQFDFTGENPGACQIKVKDGTIETVLSAKYEPGIVVESPFEVWMDVITGKLDPQKAFVEQKCKATGDFELLLKLEDWFARQD